MARRLAMGRVVARRADGAHRVTTAVAGQRLWYESADVVLDAGPEAMAGAMLMAAVQAGRTLQLVEPVSRLWLANVARMLATWREWWGYPVMMPAAPVMASSRPRRDGTALCFTGGLDSFHTLLCEPATPEVLAFVAGYDMALADRPRLAAWETTFRGVAAGIGARAVLVRSNLRRHRAFRRTDWARSHGGAIAAVGHLLAGEVGTLLISASIRTDYPYRWGSHWQLDPLWSSDRLEVVHVGAAHSRLEKMRAIAGHELAQRYLRVCWENRAETGNCSSCDKCLCTMATIAACGPTGRFVGFAWAEALGPRIDRLARTQFVLTYTELLATGLGAALDRSIRSLLERSSVSRGLRSAVRPE